MENATRTFPCEITLFYQAAGCTKMSQDIAVVPTRCKPTRGCRSSKNRLPLASATAVIASHPCNSLTEDRLPQDGLNPRRFTNSSSSPHSTSSSSLHAPSINKAPESSPVPRKLATSCPTRDQALYTFSGRQAVAQRP